MKPRRLLSLALPLLALALPPAQAAPPSSAEILAQSNASDWRRPDPDNLLLMQLPGGAVLIELAPAFAPQHVANIKKLARERYYDGLAVVRVQDNYVAQWGDPNAEAEDPALRQPMIEGKPRLPGEFSRPIAGLDLSPLPDGDVYAPGVGYYQGFPVASSRKLGRAWLAHCYGMVGAGRGDTADSGSGAELYAVIGHSPRHLDRNVTLVGRVLQGMEHLASLPRGHGPLGFYLPEETPTPIRSLQRVGELPPEQRPAVEVLRTDTATWKAYVEARRNRREDWFLEPTGGIELCNVPAPVRAVAP